jgi:hypothetical protein
VCLALAHSLHVSGFKVKCEAVDLQGTPSVSSSELSQRDSVHHTSGPHGSLGPESGSLPSRQDESKCPRPYTTARECEVGGQVGRSR